MLLRLASVGPLRSIMDNVGNGIRGPAQGPSSRLRLIVVWFTKQDGKPQAGRTMGISMQIGFFRTLDETTPGYQFIQSTSTRVSPELLIWAFPVVSARDHFESFCVYNSESYPLSKTLPLQANKASSKTT